MLNMTPVASTTITATVAGVAIDFATLAPGARSLAVFARNVNTSEHAYVNDGGAYVAGDLIVPADAAGDGKNGMWLPVTDPAETVSLCTSANTAVVHVSVWRSTGVAR